MLAGDVTMDHFGRVSVTLSLDSCAADLISAAILCHVYDYTA